MSIHPADSEIFAPVFGTDAVRRIFSDEHFISCMLRVEGALARAEARVGVIPASAGRAIDDAAKSVLVRPRDLATSTARTGMPVVGLVAALSASLGPEDARYVHFGATTQDVVDTATVLQLREALAPIEEDLRALASALVRRAEEHRATPMAGRTFLQHAAPITFGYKCALWLSPLLDHLDRLAELRRRVLLVQLGGSVGTLAALGNNGRAVVEQMAAELDLGYAAAPWHTVRDGIAEVGGFLALVCGSLAKIGNDMVLLSQTEVAEASENAESSRGGSSTLPHKRNPVASAYLVAASRGVQALAPLLSSAMAQEHERGPGGWYSERLALPPCVALAAGALAHARRVVEEMSVDVARMRRNLDATSGLVMSEHVAFALGARLGLGPAQEIVRVACTAAIVNGQTFLDAWTSDPSRAALLDRATIERLSEPSTYLGDSAGVVDRVVERARGLLGPGSLP
jgi:3-carboxy-cis,cis-muconate cycloisomerase